MAIRLRFLLVAACFWRVLTPGAAEPLAAGSRWPADLEPLGALEVAVAVGAPSHLDGPEPSVEPSVIRAGSSPEAWAAIPTDPAAPPAGDSPGAGAATPLAASARVQSSALARPAINVPAYPVHADHEHVRSFLERFTSSRRQVVGLWLSRAGRYLDMIRDVMRAKGLPEELAFTAMIESGFNPLAVSRAGAKGMWQFMASTARRYGLRVDSWVDERLDPEKSTRAAAAYLGDLYAQFGSWTLAQAAYNAGEVTVARAIRSTGSNDFWALSQSRYLRRETKEFVPQIHAATMIGREPERYGFEPPAVVEGPASERVVVPPATDLRQVSRASGVAVDALRALNPTLVRGVTPPSVPFELVVPAGSSAAVLAAVSTRPSAAQAGAVRRAAGRPDTHVVRPRDTVTSIARQYGVSVGDVLRWNRLDQQDPIRPGDRLRVAEVRTSSARD